MDYKEIAEQLAAIVCRIYDGRDAFFAIKMMADYGDGEDAQRVLAAIEFIARTTQETMNENAEKLQEIAEQIRKCSDDN